MVPVDAVTRVTNQCIPPPFWTVECRKGVKFEYETQSREKMAGYDLDQTTGKFSISTSKFDEVFRIKLFPYYNFFPQGPRYSLPRYLIIRYPRYSLPSLIVIRYSLPRYLVQGL